MIGQTHYVVNSCERPDPFLLQQSYIDLVRDVKFGFLLVIIHFHLFNLYINKNKSISQNFIAFSLCIDIKLLEIVKDKCMYVTSHIIILDPQACVIHFI